MKISEVPVFSDGVVNPLLTLICNSFTSLIDEGKQKLQSEKIIFFAAVASSQTTGMVTISIEPNCRINAPRIRILVVGWDSIDVKATCINCNIYHEMNSLGITSVTLIFYRFLWSS